MRSGAGPGLSPQAFGPRTSGGDRTLYPSVGSKPMVTLQSPFLTPSFAPCPWGPATLSLGPPCHPKVPSLPSPGSPGLPRSLYQNQRLFLQAAPPWWPMVLPQAPCGCGMHSCLGEGLPTSLSPLGSGMVLTPLRAPLSCLGVDAVAGLNVRHLTLEWVWQER